MKTILDSLLSALKSSNFNIKNNFPDLMGEGISNKNKSEFKTILDNTYPQPQNTSHEDEVAKTPPLNQNEKENINDLQEEAEYSYTDNEKTNEEIKNNDNKPEKVSKRETQSSKPKKEEKTKNFEKVYNELDNIEKLIDKILENIYPNQNISQNIKNTVDKIKNLIKNSKQNINLNLQNLITSKKYIKILKNESLAIENTNINKAILSLKNGIIDNKTLSYLKNGLAKLQNLLKKELKKIKTANNTLNEKSDIQNILNKLDKIIKNMSDNSTKIISKNIKNIKKETHSLQDKSPIDNFKNIKNTKTKTEFLSEIEKELESFKKFYGLHSKENKKQTKNDIQLNELQHIINTNNKKNETNIIKINKTNPQILIKNSEKIQETGQIKENNTGKQNTQLNLFLNEMKTVKNTNPTPANMNKTPNQFSSMVDRYLQLEKSVMGQINRHIRMYMGKDVSRMTVDLEPPELGKVNLKLEMNGNILLGKIRVENHDVKDIISSKLDELKETLSQIGINIEKMEVYVKSETQQNNNLFEMTGENIYNGLFGQRKEDNTNQKKQYIYNDYESNLLTSEKITNENEEYGLIKTKDGKIKINLVG